MGFLMWVLAGLAVGTGARLVAHVVRARGPGPGFGLALGGAVLGGFVVDLFIKGDSVAQFKGPTLVGATIGALVLMFISYAASRTTRSNRRTT